MHPSLAIEHLSHVKFDVRKKVSLTQIEHAVEEVQFRQLLMKAEHN
jgi:hypothetical protein